MSIKAEPRVDPALWRPGASLDALRARARLLARLRAFFADREVLEVDTPHLARTTVPEPSLTSLQVHQGTQRHYLQSSPEGFMKRLVAADAGAIYQLGSVFRAGESGRLHNPEFTLLEWYRPGFDDRRLMDEVATLVAAELDRPWPLGLTFADLFETGARVDPHRADASALYAALEQVLAMRAAAPAATLRDADRATLMDALYAELIEQRPEPAFFVYDFPETHAALARLREDVAGRRVAARFELIVDGVELANGFHELADADEQRARFNAEREARRAAGQDVPPLDERLLAALEHGLPDCAGVALGVDRLLMLALGKQSLDAVQPFSFARV